MIRILTGTALCLAIACGGEAAGPDGSAGRPGTAGSSSGAAGASGAGAAGTAGAAGSLWDPKGPQCDEIDFSPYEPGLGNGSVFAVQRWACGAGNSAWFLFGTQPPGGGSGKANLIRLNPAGTKIEEMSLDGLDGAYEYGCNEAGAFAFSGPNLNVYSPDTKTWTKVPPPPGGGLPDRFLPWDGEAFVEVRTGGTTQEPKWTSRRVRPDGTIAADPVHVSPCNLGEEQCDRQSDPATHVTWTLAGYKGALYGVNGSGKLLSGSGTYDSPPMNFNATLLVESIAPKNDGRAWAIWQYDSNTPQTQDFPFYIREVGADGVFTDLQLAPGSGVRMYDQLRARRVNGETVVVTTTALLGGEKVFETLYVADDGKMERETTLDCSLPSPLGPCRQQGVIGLRLAMFVMDGSAWITFDDHTNESPSAGGLLYRRIVRLSRGCHIRSNWQKKNAK